MNGKLYRQGSSIGFGIHHKPIQTYLVSPTDSNNH